MLKGNIFMPGRSSHNQGNAVLSNIQAHSHLGYETVRKNPTSSASTANILKKNTNPKEHWKEFWLQVYVGIYESRYM